MTEYGTSNFDKQRMLKSNDVSKIRHALAIALAFAAGVPLYAYASPSVVSGQGVMYAQSVVPSHSAPSDPSTQGPVDAKAIQIVIANGLGSSVESAVQNAAENALVQVVGSLVDSEKQIERRTQISDGIRAETRNISTKVREYSQGSIQSFEVLATSQDGGIVRVSAKVGVRIEDFRAYIGKVVQGDVAISKGLFAQAATEQKQQENSSELFIDRVIKPIEENVGVSLTVGEPTKVTSDNLPCTVSNFGGEVSLIGGVARAQDTKPECPQALNNWVREGTRRNSSSIYNLPVTLSVPKDVREGIAKVAKEIANNDCPKFDLRNSKSNGVASGIQDKIAKEMIKRFGNHYSPRPQIRYAAVVLRDGSSPFADVCFQAISEPAAYDAVMSSLAKTELQISFLGKQGELIERYSYFPYETPRDVQRSTAESPNLIPSILPRRPPNQFGSDYQIFVLAGDQNFDILVDIPLNVLRDAERAEVKLIH